MGSPASNGGGVAGEELSLSEEGTKLQGAGIAAKEEDGEEERSSSSLIKEDGQLKVIRERSSEVDPCLSVFAILTLSSVCLQYNPCIHQVFNFNPTYLNQYYGSNDTSLLSLNQLQNSINQQQPLLSPITPNTLQLQPHQQPLSPGFLTGAGYHFGLSGSQLLGGVRLPGSPLFSFTQVASPLHSSTILGDKNNLAQILQEGSVNLESRDRWGRVALVYGILSNHQEAVEALLKAGARIDAIDSHRRTPLHYAAYKGNLGSLKALLSNIELNRSNGTDSFADGLWLAQDAGGVTPLHHAAHHNSPKFLQALLKYAAPGTLDIEDHHKRTPLHWAAAYGSEENVRLLIKHGANNLLPDQEGKTPLHWASMSKTEGVTNCVKILISTAPSSVNWQDYDGITALHLAVAEAQQDTVEVLLGVTKCKVDICDNQFRTPLHWAANRGLTSIVGLLLGAGATLSAVDVYGATPLHYAAQLNHARTVELVVRRPSIREEASKDGCTALLWAAARGADDAIKVMVRHGALVQQCDPRGCTALHIAAGGGHVSTVSVLLRLRAHPDHADNEGRTPLQYAALGGHANIVKLLAQAGASLHHQDAEGQCALHHSVISGHLHLAHILIKAGSSVNVTDYYGRTPLHMAAWRGLSNIIYLLLENRGDVNARDHQGKSALHWAAEHGHLGAVNTLLGFHAYPNYTSTTKERYTAVDCAYVAEHLEVAEVLLEAGGVSITCIMEVAAIKIQSVFRGRQAREKYLKHMRSLKLNGKYKLANVESELNCENLQSIIQSSKIDPCSQKILNQKIHTEGGILEKVNTVTSELGHRTLKSDQLSSKGLTSSFLHGSRKKTVRNLQLPNPEDLGLDREIHNEDIESIHKEVDYADINRAIQGHSIILGQSLHSPAANATALIKTTLKPIDTKFTNPSTNSNSEDTENSIELKTENEDCIIKDHFLRKNKELQMQKCKPSNKKSLKEIIMQIDNVSTHFDITSQAKTDFLKRKCENRNIKFINLKEHKIGEAETASKDFRIIEKGNQSHQQRRKHQERAGDQSKMVMGVLSAVEKAKAQDKWNKQLATLKLQEVRCPKKDNTQHTISYNIVEHTAGHKPSSNKLSSFPKQQLENKSDK
ncbi:unnamed protein product, partial [Meganyctiphanes norvegica]